MFLPNYLENLYETNYYFFTVITGIVFILYVISAIGLSRSAPEYLSPSIDCAVIYRYFPNLEI